MKAIDLIHVFGSQAALARWCGITRAAVHKWTLTGDVPELWQYRIRERRPSIDREILQARDQKRRRA